MKYILLTIALFSVNAYAGLFDSKLQYYECPNMESANKCNSSCVKEKGYEIEPKVNKSASIVIIARYQDGKVDGGSTSENCKIIDSKNWSCTYETPRAFSSDKMINGQYSHYFWMKLPNGTESISHSCAK